MIPRKPSPYEVDLLAAVRLREALEAVERGDKPAAIDADSWEGIQARLAQFGSDLPALLDSLGGNR